MTIIDNRTTNLDLPLPHVDNALQDDVGRLRSALTAIDTASLLKADLVAGKVPAGQLPSYVDDVLEVANFAALPGTGETGKIYVTLDDGKAFRWSGSVYVEISPSPGSTDVITEGSTNLYFTVARVRAVVLAGLSTATNAVIDAADTVLVAFGKLQAQVSALATAIGAGTLGAPFTELQITPTSDGQTVFTVPGGYTVGSVQIFLNGSKLVVGDDVTATNGTSITLAVGINIAGNTIEVVKFKQAVVA